MTTSGGPLRPDSASLDLLAELFRGLSHPVRLRILLTLRDRGVLSPAALSRSIGPAVGLERVAYHTHSLRLLGLIVQAGTRGAGGSAQHFYRLSPSGRALLKLLDDHAGSIARSIAT
jgi:DNA-binding transcriptional ArsR family regulator